MDLLERIKDTLPDSVIGDYSETPKLVEALADQHAVGFANYIRQHAVPFAGGFTLGGTYYTTEQLLSIYKRRYPNGY